MVLAHFPLDPTGKRTDGLRDLRSLLTVWERATDYPPFPALSEVGA